MEENHMSSKKFTEEEMYNLKASPYVLKVSPGAVHFSALFKEKVWNALQLGMAARDAIAGLGIDPEILGATRISGIATTIRSEVRAGKGFRDLYTYDANARDYANIEVKVRYLEQRLAYKEQEVEFLKKIVSLGKGAEES